MFFWNSLAFLVIQWMLAIWSLLPLPFLKPEELPHTQGQEWRLRGHTPCPMWAAAVALCWSSREEIPQVQGKRNPGKTVGTERGHQRADRLKPQAQTTSQSDHRTTALSNSVKLSHAVWGHPRQTGHGGEVWQNVVHWRREWQTASVFLPWEPHEQYEINYIPR